jgi:hypothetical protein
MRAGEIAGRLVAGAICAGFAGLALASGAVAGGCISQTFNEFARSSVGTNIFNVAMSAAASGATALPAAGALWSGAMALTRDPEVW